MLDAFSAFSLDTMRGLCVMSMPGPDEWSRQQGTPRTDPGPIEVGGGEFVMDLFDNYLGMGDQLARPVALGLGEALSDRVMSREVCTGSPMASHPRNINASLVPIAAGARNPHRRKDLPPLLRRRLLGRQGSPRRQHRPPHQRPHGRTRLIVRLPIPR